MLIFLYRERFDKVPRGKSIKKSKDWIQAKKDRRRRQGTDPTKPTVGTSETVGIGFESTGPSGKGEYGPSAKPDETTTTSPSGSA